MIKLLQSKSSRYGFKSILDSWSGQNMILKQEWVLIRHDQYIICPVFKSPSGRTTLCVLENLGKCVWPVDPKVDPGWLGSANINIHLLYYTRIMIESGTDAADFIAIIRRMSDSKQSSLCSSIGKIWWNTMQSSYFSLIKLGC